MLKRAESLLLGVHRLVDVTAAILMTAITLVMLAQVLFRYVINDSLVWSEELSIYLMAWVVFLGAAVVLHDWEHIRISVFVRAMPGSFYPYFVILAKVGTLLFVAFVAVYGIESFIARFHANSTSMGISTRWAKLSIPVGAILMLAFGAVVIWRDLAELIRGNSSHFIDEDGDEVESEQSKV